MAVTFLVLSLALPFALAGIVAAAKAYRRSRESFLQGRINVHTFADTGERMANLVLVGVIGAVLMGATVNALIKTTSASRQIVADAITAQR